MQPSEERSPQFVFQKKQVKNLVNKHGRCAQGRSDQKVAEQKSVKNLTPSPPPQKYDKMLILAKQIQNGMTL